MVGRTESQTNLLGRWYSGRGIPGSGGREVWRLGNTEVSQKFKNKKWRPTRAHGACNIARNSNHSFLGVFSSPLPFPHMCSVLPFSPRLMMAIPAPISMTFLQLSISVTQAQTLQEGNLIGPFFFPPPTLGYWPAYGWTVLNHSPTARCQHSTTWNLCGFLDLSQLKGKSLRKQWG